MFSLSGREMFQFQPPASPYLHNELVAYPYVYLNNGQGIIYRHHIQKNIIDSIKVNSSPAYILKRIYQGKETLFFVNNLGYDCHDLESLKLLQRILPDGTGKPILVGDKMYCLIKNKQLTSYDINAKKVLWSVTTSPKDLKWLGVTVGTFDDTFMCYSLNKDKSSLYVTTLFGSLYKVNPFTGAIIKQIDRFRGDANNAGLITEFSLADVNGDGVEDLIGSAVDYNIYAISGKDLSVLWAYNTGYENQAGVALYDITGDGVVDVFTINDKMKLSIINGKTGEKIHEHQIQPEKGQAKVILADINNNGLLDVFISGGRKAIRAYEMPAVKVPVGGIFWTPEG